VNDEGRPVRVLLVDDHALFRNGVKALLSRRTEVEVVGDAGDALEGVKRAAELRPDVVLLDLHMPGMSGREALRLIIDQDPDVRVIMLTVSEDAEDLLDTLKAGAAGYLLKNTDADYLVQSVCRASQGESVVAPQMTGMLVSGLKSLARGERQVDVPPSREKLTPREIEILVALASGASNKEIARDLRLAESTVKIHVQHILRKLELSSRVQAAVYAVEQGLVARTSGQGG
jgi:two-component system nitrate/nitrite response regulator NarL